MAPISPSSRKTSYAPVTPTTAFPVNFPIADNADLKVFVNGLPRTDFTVAATYPDGLSYNAVVNMNSAVTGNVVILGNRVPRRQNQFQTGRPLPIPDQNAAFNTQEIEIQEARRDVDRAIKMPPGYIGLTLDPAISDGATLMRDGDQIVEGPNLPDLASSLIADAAAQANRAHDEADRAEDARDIAAGYASDAVSQGNVPIYGTIAGMVLIEVPDGINGIRVNGLNAVGDGYGGFFTDADTGGPVVFTSGGETSRAWYKGYPEPMSDDATSVPGDPRKFWEDSYFGNPAEGKVGRLNRLFVGVAALSGGDRPATPSTWVDQYFEVITDSQLAVVSALGSLAITGVSRASDYRTFIGASAGGAQGVSGFAVNDDTIGPAVAAGVYGEVIHLPGVPGITEAAEFTVSNGGAVVDITPVGGITSGATFSINLSAGFRAAYNHNVSAYMVFGSNTGHGVVARKGIVSLDGLDHSVGAGGRGVAFELLRQQSIRILDETNTTDAEMFSDASGLHIKSKAVLVDDLALGQVLLSAGWAPFNTIMQATTGALGTNSALLFYKKIGSTILYRGKAAITSNGTGSGSLAIFLPFYAQGDDYATGRASGVSGAIQGVVSADDNRVVLLDKNDGYLGADGRTLSFSGQYEAHP